MWVEHKSFMNLINKAWEDEVGDSRFLCFARKLKSTKNRIKIFLGRLVFILVNWKKELKTLKLLCKILFQKRWS